MDDAVGENNFALLLIRTNYDTDNEMYCKIQNATGRQELSAINSCIKIWREVGPRWTLLSEGMLRTCVVLALILTAPGFFVRGGAFIPPRNWCLLSATSASGWMDKGQSVFLEVILTGSKCQPHLLISILWGSVSLSVTGCHVRGWAFVGPGVNDDHMHIPRV